MLKYHIPRLTLVLACVSCVPAKKSEVASSDDQTKLFTFEEYAQMCQRALGDAPEVDCSLQPSPERFVSQHIGDWKRDTLSDVRLTEEAPLSGEDGGLPTDKAPQYHSFQCINDSWILAGGFIWPRCDSKSVIQKSVSKSPKGDRVTWIAACRVKELPRLMGGNGQMGLIGYNESTGETCFFNKSSLPADRKIPSANSKDSAAVYDDWATIAKSTPCVQCHHSSPWVHSPELMPERIHAALKDSAYARSTMHKPTSDWLKSDYEPPFDPPLVPSSIMLTSRKVGTKGIPYIVVAREKLENAKGVEKRPFAPGSWTPKRLHPATQKAIYCLACHDNVGSPKTPQMAFMFGASGRSVLPKGAGNNWHDIMFGTHLDQRKIDEFFSMSQTEIEDAWRPHVEE